MDTLFPPIIWTFICAIILVIADAFTKKESKINIWLATLMLLFIGTTAFLNINHPTNIPTGIETFIAGMLNFSKIANIFDIVFCLSAVLAIIPSKEYFSKVYEHHKEYYSLIFFALFGMMCIAHSNNLVVLFLGIETMSITFYALTGFLRKRESAVEGALKYFLLGAFSSGFLLYGIAMLYGATGSMYNNEIAASIQNLHAFPLYLKLGIGMLIIGLLFKVAAFPFHQWAPDVYQAAATPVSGFMSTAGKIAALAGIISIFTFLSPALQNATENTLSVPLLLIIAVIAATTMIVGNVTALAQKNIKRMLAYSSVGHAGYMLMGIVANSNEGTTGILYYSIAYTLTQIGAFIVIAILERKDESYLETADYAGISKQFPIIAATMAIFMFSLAGIPPFAGFFGKYFIFKAAINAGFTWLTIVAVITSLIACYFYLSVIVQMYFKNREKENMFIEKHGVSKFIVILTAIGIIIVGVLPIIDYLQ